MNQPKFEKGTHYDNIVDALDNVEVKYISEEVYQFHIVERDRKGNLIKSYEPIIITPDTDLSLINKDILYEFDMSMYYWGEGNSKEGLKAKRSNTRQNIQGLN